MNKLHSRQSASGSRRLRRSLTEITMPTTRSAVLERLSPAQPTPTVQPRLAKWRDKGSCSKVVVRRKKITPENATEASDIAAGRLPQTKPLNGAGLDGHNVFHAFEDVTSAAAKAAKDYRSWMFEHMQSNINTALNYASGLATMSLSARLDAFSVSRAREQRKDPGTSKPEKHISATANTAAKFCAKSFELMATNVITTFEYAQRLADLTSPAEFVELSTGQARKQVELAMRYRAALRALSQPSAPTNVGRSNAGFAKALTRQK
jgi:hypothetical protein